MATSYLHRMIRASKLDANIYEEVEADRTATGQAMGVVVMSSAAAGIGGMTRYGVQGLVGGIVVALVGWFLWAFITYIIGTRLLPEPQTEANHGELLRTIGFSSAPGILRVFGIIPGLFGILNALTGVWMLMAMIVAVRQALDYSGTFRAVIVCLIGWIVQVALVIMLYVLVGC